MTSNTRPEAPLDKADRRIDQSDFVASKWMPTTGRFAEYSVCYEWIGGKWEGFTSVRKPRTT